MYSFWDNSFHLLSALWIGFVLNNILAILRRLQACITKACFFVNAPHKILSQSPRFVLVHCLVPAHALGPNLHGESIAFRTTMAFFCGTASHALLFINAHTPKGHT